MPDSKGFNCEQRGWHLVWGDRCTRPVGTHRGSSLGIRCLGELFSHPPSPNLVGTENGERCSSFYCSAIASAGGQYWWRADWEGEGDFACLEEWRPTSKDEIPVTVNGWR